MRELKTLVLLIIVYLTTSCTDSNRDPVNNHVVAPKAPIRTTKESNHLTDFMNTKNIKILSLTELSNLILTRKNFETTEIYESSKFKHAFSELNKRLLSQNISSKSTKKQIDIFRKYGELAYTDCNSLHTNCEILNIFNDDPDSFDILSNYINNFKNYIATDVFLFRLQILLTDSKRAVSKKIAQQYLKTAPFVSSFLNTPEGITYQKTHLSLIEKIRSIFPDIVKKESITLPQAKFHNDILVSLSKKTRSSFRLPKNELCIQIFDAIYLSAMDEESVSSVVSSLESDQLSACRNDIEPYVTLRLIETASKSDEVFLSMIKQVKAQSSKKRYIEDIQRKALNLNPLWREFRRKADLLKNFSLSNFVPATASRAPSPIVEIFQSLNKNANLMVVYPKVFVALYYLKDFVEIQHGPNGELFFNTLGNKLDQLIHGQLKEPILTLDFNPINISKVEFLLVFHYAITLGVFERYKVSAKKFIEIFSEAFLDKEREHVKELTQNFKGINAATIQPEFREFCNDSSIDTINGAIRLTRHTERSIQDLTKYLFYDPQYSIGYLKTSKVVPNNTFESVVTEVDDKIKFVQSLMTIAKVTNLEEKYSSQDTVFSDYIDFFKSSLAQGAQCFEIWSQVETQLRFSVLSREIAYLSRVHDQMTFLRQSGNKNLKSTINALHKPSRNPFSTGEVIFEDSFHYYKYDFIHRIGRYLKSGLPLPTLISEGYKEETTILPPVAKTISIKWDWDNISVEEKIKSKQIAYNTDKAVFITSALTAALHNTGQSSFVDWRTHSHFQNNYFKLSGQLKAYLASPLSAEDNSTEIDKILKSVTNIYKIAHIKNTTDSSENFLGRSEAEILSYSSERDKIYVRENYTTTLLMSIKNGRELRSIFDFSVDQLIRNREIPTIRYSIEFKKANSMIAENLQKDFYVKNPLHTALQYLTDRSSVGHLWVAPPDNFFTSLDNINKVRAERILSRTEQLICTLNGDLPLKAFSDLGLPKPNELQLDLDGEHSSSHLEFTSIDFLLRPQKIMEDFFKNAEGRVANLKNGPDMLPKRPLYNCLKN